MLRLDDIYVSYGAIQALRGVSIEVPVGKIVTIIGANGAGKSTLLKSVAGLEKIAAGKIEFEGADICRVPPNRRTALGLALSPEGRGVFPDQTVKDNLLLGAYAKRRSAAGIEEKIERFCRMFPRLKERQHQLAGTLSGGEQQMLAIARALMSEPRLLLLDEPSLGLAPQIIHDIFKTIRTLRESGVTILLVEQMANLALAVADHAYVLETGSITHEGRGVDLLKDPRVRAAYLGAH